MHVQLGFLPDGVARELRVLFEAAPAPVHLTVHVASKAAPRVESGQRSSKREAEKQAPMRLAVSLTGSLHCSPAVEGFFARCGDVAPLPDTGAASPPGAGFPVPSAPGAGAGRIG